MKGEIPSRADFGPGKAGEKAYSLIYSKNPCFVWVEDKKGKKRCGEVSNATLDFDEPFGRELEQIPVCSDDHFELAKRDLQNEYDKLGRNLSTGKNGWGRA